MEITLDDNKIIVEQNKIINIGNGWNTFELSDENSPAPKLYYFKPTDGDLKAIPFDKYVELLTEGETIEGMLKKLNMSIDGYCEKQQDPKPKICTDKHKIKELNKSSSEESEEKLQTTIEKSHPTETKDISKYKEIITSHLNENPQIKNILKYIN